MLMITIIINELEEYFEKCPFNLQNRNVDFEFEMSNLFQDN